MRTIVLGVIVMAGLVGCGIHEAVVTPANEHVAAGESEPITQQEGFRRIVDERSGIFMRESWAKEGPDATKIPPMGTVQMITVMQVREAKIREFIESQEVATYLEYVRQFHTHTSRGYGDGDITYHFAVDRAGHVWQCRPLGFQGAIMTGHNDGNVGVMVMGDPDAAVPEAQKRATIWLLETLRTKYGLPMSRVFTKNELVTTDEPGAEVVAFMKSFRLGPAVTRPATALAEVAIKPLSAKITIASTVRGNPDQILAISDQDQLTKLVAFFPGVGKGKKSPAPVAGAWRSEIRVEFSLKNATLITVETGGNGRFWSEGDGDWPLDPGLKAFVDSLNKSQAK